MSPERKITINGYKIEEYWWCGDFCCYVNNKLSKNTYDENVKELSKK